MAYTKTIVCFANSRRPGGRCIAGKEVTGEGYGDWVRPISVGESEAISWSTRRMDTGSDPAVLDVVRIRFSGPRPGTYQSENHLVDPQFQWTKTGEVDWQGALAAVDRVEGPLWRNGWHTQHGINDKVPEVLAQTLTNSLCLIRLGNIEISVAREGGDFGPPRRRVRASFEFNGANYKLGVTDSIIEDRYKARGDGTYMIGDPLLCISLSGLFHGFAFKLVAAIITSD